MGLLGDLFNIGGAILGHKSDKKQNKLAKEELAVQRDLANRQIDISKYIEELSRKVAGLSGNITDPWGGTTVYDPKTGTYKSTMGAVPRRLQDASDAEELARLTLDQAIRRRGLSDYEAMRGRSMAEADTALRELGAFKQGVGRVDAGRVGSQLRADRMRAINAGYDDAERAAQTLQLRTGSGALTDALANLARDRVRTQATVGSPELEGMEFAENINNQRQKGLLDRYKLFGDEGRAFYDTAFQPSDEGDKYLGLLADLMKFDLSKYDLALGGSAQGASTIGNAAAGRNAAWGAYNQNRIHAPTAKFLQGIGENADSIFKNIMAFGG